MKTIFIFEIILNIDRYDVTKSDLNVHETPRKYVRQIKKKNFKKDNVIFGEKMRIIYFLYYSIIMMSSISTL